MSRVPGLGYSPEFRQRTLAYEADHGIAATAREFKISKATVRSWKRSAATAPVNTVAAPSELFLCPACSGQGKARRGGIWIDPGGQVSDVAMLYRISGVIDLGSKGRGSGSTPRSDGQASRAGRSHAKDRREGEHA